METLIKAPSINEIKIDKLSANYVSIEWDDVGRNFYYLVEIKEVSNDGGWLMIKHVSEPKITIDTLQPQTDYQIRIRVSSRGFEPSEYTYSEVFKSFMYNLYTFNVMNELTLADKFIEEKFTENNKDYIDFDRDIVYASLMSTDYKFVNSIPSVSYVDDKILRRDEYHEVLGKISKLCTNDKRVMVGYIDEVMYMVERYQKIAKVSNDKGQTWQIVELFDGRIGDPISNTIFYQTSMTTYALGYTHLFYGRPSSNIRWSSIRERFSQIDVSFTRMDDQLNLGYEIEVFNRFAKLPEEMDNGKAEAFASSEDAVYVAGNGVIRYLKFDEQIYDEEPTSPTYNQRLFNPEVIKVGDPDIVIKKMDVLDGEVLLLVTGRLKKGKKNKHNVHNITECGYRGVYRIVGDGVERVFGNTEKERNYIEHMYTNMSVNGKEFFVNYANYKHDTYEDTDVKITENDVEDDLIISRQIRSRGFLNSAKVFMGSFRASYRDVTKWEKGFMKYYNESDFSYMARSKNRAFITNEKRFGIVHGERRYTKSVELAGPGSEERIMRETWIDGEVTINMPDITFNDFNTYASGILIYNSFGKIIGFYEFFVNVIDEVSIIWKPKQTMLTASLIGQTRDYVEKEPSLKRPEDPNLVPFIRKITPENYFRNSDIEESRYYAFIKNYLEILSDGRDSTYKGMLNVVRNKDPLEVDSFEYLWSEMYKRNIYLDKSKKEETIRFFLSRKNDFYSSAGTVQSYKFLFKLLYNEEVEIDDESSVLNYYITVNMDTIDQNIIGKTLFTKTGRCHITNIDRVYIDGKKRWHLSVSNMIGAMHKGQVVQSEDGRYKGLVDADLKGKELLYNDIDYINRGRSYYVMRIKSKLPMSRYKDDIIRFVHPLGIDFKGIVDLTMFMNAGIHFRHMQTEINRYANLRFDAGFPTHYPNRVRKYDNNGQPVYDVYTGKPVYEEHPMNGVEFKIDVASYNAKHALKDPNKVKNVKLREYLVKTLPDKRRSRFSPLFDASATTFSCFTDLTDSFLEDSYKYRLKDNVGMPRDPKDPTQKKLEE